MRLRFSLAISATNPDEVRIAIEVGLENTLHLQAAAIFQHFLSLCGSQLDESNPRGEAPSPSDRYQP
jgi:hypothetical protein